MFYRGESARYRASIENMECERSSKYVYIFLEETFGAWPPLAQTGWHFSFRVLNSVYGTKRKEC